jgi:hypothetical protein
MDSNSKEKMKAGRPLVLVLRQLVSIWRRYIGLQSWALVVYAILLLATRNLLSIGGLVLAAATAFLVLLYYVDKWLAKFG